MKLYMLNQTIFIWIQFKFHKVPFITYRVMAEDGFFLNLGNQRKITDDTLLKRHMHNITIFIYIQYKFNGIPSIGFLDMAEDRKFEGWKMD